MPRDYSRSAIVDVCDAFDLDINDPSKHPKLLYWLVRNSLRGTNNPDAYGVVQYFRDNTRSASKRRTYQGFLDAMWPAVSQWFGGVKPPPGSFGEFGEPIEE